MNADLIRIFKREQWDIIRLSWILQHSAWDCRALLSKNPPWILSEYAIERLDNFERLAAEPFVPGHWRRHGLKYSSEYRKGTSLYFTIYGAIQELESVHWHDGNVDRHSRECELMRRDLASVRSYKRLDDAARVTVRLHKLHRIFDGHQKTGAR